MMHLTATIIEHGHYFKAAIKFKTLYYVYNKIFKNEIDAQKYADKLEEKIEQTIFNILKKAKFVGE